jgi:acetylornithine deacetylase/succinyl-diaminopimelate desuccinylase-like protein
MSRRQATVEILEALVGFDTTSRNSNLAAVAWIEAYLDRLGVVHERVADRSGSKADLWSTLGLAGRTERGKMAFGTDAGLFAQAGIPSVVIGPGSIERADKADEFIAATELDARGAFIDRLIAHCRR